MRGNAGGTDSPGRTRPAPGLFHLALRLAPALVLIALLFGGGLALGVLQALEAFPGNTGERMTLTHFATVLTDPDFGRSLGLTLHIAATSTLIAAAAAIPLALGIMRMASTSRAVTFLLQIPLTVPHLVIAVSTLLLFAPAGLFSRWAKALGFISGPADFPLLTNDDYAIGILAVYVWKEIPFITFMLLAVLKNAGTELDDVGRTLKASRLQRFSHITLPIIFPSLGAACLIVFAFTFGAFEVPYLLGKTYPMPLPVWAFRSYSDIDLVERPEGIAIGLIIAGSITLTVILSQLLIQAARRRGLTA